MNAINYFGLLVVALVLMPASAAADSGFTEFRVAAFPGADGTQWQLVERLRPRFSADITKRIKLYTEVELNLTQGRNQETELREIIEGSDFGPVLVAAGHTWPEHENEFLQIDGPGDYLDVARLYADFYFADFDLRIGRQSIYWGSAAMLNPTDPFPELLVAEPWKPRRGTNAIRANIPMGDVSDLTVVVGTNDTFKTFRAAARLRTLVAEADIALVGAYRGDDQDGLIGIDIRGNWGIGYWVEAAVSSSAWDKVDVAVGFDYSFPVLDTLVVMLQYYRNGRGGSENAGVSGLNVALPEVLTGGDIAEVKTFAPILSGTDYGMVSVNQSFSPEFAFNVVMLQNLGDGTAMAIPTMVYKPLGWLDFSLSGQIPCSIWGDGGEFKPKDADMVIRQVAETPAGEMTADLSGIVPDVTLTLWSRASF